MPWTRAIPSLWSPSADCVSLGGCDGAGCGVPDGEDTTGLGEGVLLLDAADALLEDGRDLGGRGLCIGSVGAGGGERRGAGLWWKSRQYGCWLLGLARLG